MNPLGSIECDSRFMQDTGCREQERGKSHIGNDAGSGTGAFYRQGTTDDSEGAEEEQEEPS